MVEYEDEDSRTIFIANLSDKVTEALLYELFMQVKWPWVCNVPYSITKTNLSFQGGPLEKVSQPKDKEGRVRAFAFITYVSGSRWFD